MSNPRAFSPAPGSPEWLRKRADDEQSADAKVAAILGENPFADGSELIAGLRAAAERIEELERVSKDLAGLAFESDEENDALLASVSNYIRKCAELSDEVQRLRAENEQLKQDKERLDWLLEHGAVGHFSEWRDAEGGKERTLFRLHSRADIDAARKEGAP